MAEYHINLSSKGNISFMNKISSKNVINDICHKMCEKSILSENGRTYYWISGENKEVAIVFLPGLTANHTLFEKQLAYFSGKYTVIVWDCPCHGKSRPYKNFNYSNVSKELNTILMTEGIGKTLIVGQSLGGMIGQYYIDAYPEGVIGFISIDSAPFGDYYSGSDFFWLSQLEWMCRLFPDNVLRKSMAKMCGASPEARASMGNMLADYSKKELCHLMYIGEAAFIPENKSIELPCETILILGEMDKVGKVASLNKKWADKTGYPLKVIKNAAHNSNDDRPEEVNRIIEDFLLSKIYAD